MAVKPDLTGVPETALWTLWFRALAARRGVLDDPLAASVVAQLDYPFADTFGDNFPFHAQAQAARVRTFDEGVRDFLRDYPKGTVVALGEGLETQFWRVDNGTMRWLTVDLPQSVALRQQLLPEDPRQSAFAGSALDDAWHDSIDKSDGVCITAQGLLMYLRPEEVHALFDRLATAFPGGTMLFDTIPPWMAGSIRRGSLRFTPPPLPWSLEPAELRTLKRYGSVEDVRPAPAPGLPRKVAIVARYVPVVRNMRPMVVKLTFGA
ncbi:class I SAM-dependent methyltransferase [Catelliglobosispora koreensis]|uniref:class I SAM-dependent methyltransferase n=1 Tax=Catelliglobosispora koreensis TaxID=129052 RepID=UPI00037ED6F5|nr:class I SAM-dependent methyltransferase [Catelliglobosispora koreensis]